MCYIGKIRKTYSWRLKEGRLEYVIKIIKNTTNGI